MDIVEYALDKAREIKSERNKFRHYCVITDKRGRIVSEAANSYVKTHPVMHRQSQKMGLIHKDFCHAEVLALIRSRGNGCNLTVVRVGSNGKQMNSKPCVICEEIISQSKHIRSVQYTN